MPKLNFYSMISKPTLSLRRGQQEPQLLLKSRGIYLLWQVRIRHQKKIFLKTTERGIPILGIAFISAFLPLSYMSISESSSTVFSWFQELVSANTLLRWVLISANHIHMDTQETRVSESRFALFNHTWTLCC